MTLLVDGSFEHAVRRLLECPDEAVTSCDIEGGGEVQIGDCTWDTEPMQIVLRAYVPGIDGDYVVRANPDLRKYRGKTWKRTFDSLPELWEALHPEEE